jgi:hypothetical protein
VVRKAFYACTLQADMPPLMIGTMFVLEVAWILFNSPADGRTPYLGRDVREVTQGFSDGSRPRASASSPAIVKYSAVPPFARFTPPTSLG